MSKWTTTSLGNIFEIARGGSPRPIQNFLTDDPTGLNWIMIGDTVEGSKYITATKKRIRPEGLKKSRLVHEGDFLLTNSMSFGRPYILKTSGCIHDGWLVLSPRDGNVHPDFFYYLLGSKTLYREFSRRAAGAVVKNLNTELVRSVEIPVPPLGEQKRIAAILDAADALRAKRRETLAQLDTLLQSTFLDMFGDPVANPKGWAMQSMGKLCSILTGFAFPSADFLAPNKGIALCRGINVGIGQFSWKDRADWVVPYDNKLEKFQIQQGDIILAMDRPWISGGLKAAVADKEDLPALLVQRVARIRSLDPLRQKLVYFLIKSPVFSNHCNPTETTIPHISPNDLRSFPVIQPPIDLQRRFTTIVESVEQQKTRLRAHLTELDTLFASLQDRAFKGAL